MASVLEVAAKVPEARRTEFIGAAFRSVRFHAGTSPSSRGNGIRSSIQQLREADLKLLEADKSGVLVVLDKKLLEEKTSIALNKNPVGKPPSGSLRTESKSLCEALNLV